MTQTPRPRPYHHGDLTATLVAAGLELARTGGPEAISIREVTRAAGVSPNAAYRHFADRAALVVAVARRAQEQAAERMTARFEQAGADAADDAERAVTRLRAVGLGYVDFALANPGLFQLAFRNRQQRTDAAGEPPAPFRMLVSALDDLVTAGALPPRRRADAEWPCWSAVHGIADLATRGPLAAQPRTAVDHLVAVVVDRAIEGVLGHPLARS